MQTQTFNTAQAIAQHLGNKDIPAFIWGAPGIGKSALIHAMAKANGARVIDIRLSMFDPVDLRGLPATIDGLTVWLKPSFWPSIDGELVYLFFDEMDRAPASVKNAALQIVLDRRIGEHVLPDSVRIFAAGNGETDKGFAGSMGTALNNRFAHIAMESDVESWCAHADKMNWNPAIVAFLRMRGGESGIFHELAPSRDQKAYPTARAWERVHHALIDCPKGLEFNVVASLIGDAVAGEFVAFLDMFGKLPDLNQIIANPSQAPVFTELNMNFAIACALARVSDAGNFANVVTYAERMPREFEILCVTSAVNQHGDELKNTQAYTGYALRNQEVFGASNNG